MFSIKRCVEIQTVTAVLAKFKTELLCIIIHFGQAFIT